MGEIKEILSGVNVFIESGIIKEDRLEQLYCIVAELNQINLIRSTNDKRLSEIKKEINQIIYN